MAQLLQAVHSQHHDVQETAAALSKVAAKAEDPVLVQLSEEADSFVDWLSVVRAPAL